MKRAWWRWWPVEDGEPVGKREVAPHFDQLVQSWDTSFGDNEEAISSYVVGQLWGQFGADKYLIRQVRERMEFTETVDAVRQITEWAAKHYPALKGTSSSSRTRPTGRRSSRSWRGSSPAWSA